MGSNFTTLTTYNCNNKPQATSRPTKLKFSALRAVVYKLQIPPFLWNVDKSDAFYKSAVIRITIVGYLRSSAKYLPRKKIITLVNLFNTSI